MDAENAPAEKARGARQLGDQTAREGDPVPRAPLAFLTYDDLKGIVFTITRDGYGTQENGTTFLTVKGEEGENALDAALANPRLPYHEDMAGRASGLFCSLILGHGLNDGNKRLALVAMQLFLLRNDYMLMLSDVRLQALAVAVASGAIRREQVQEELRPYLFDMTLDSEALAQQAITSGIAAGEVDRWIAELRSSGLFAAVKALDAAE